MEKMTMFTMHETAIEPPVIDYEDHLIARRDALWTLLNDRTVVLPKQMRKAAKGELSDIGLVRRLLDRFRPGTPPANWYGGFVRPLGLWGDHPSREALYGWKMRDDSLPKWPGLGLPLSGIKYRLFNAPIPLEAVKQWKIARRIVKEKTDIRVYSPRSEDFDEVVVPVACEPAIFARVVVGDVPYYFEVARWDVERDLEELWKRGAGITE